MSKYCAKGMRMLRYGVKLLLPVSVPRLQASVLMLVSLAVTQGFACTLGTKSISCTIPSPQQVNSYRLQCTLYFADCDNSTVDATYTVNYYSTKTSCECQDKRVENGSIRCVVPEMSGASDDREQCSFAHALPFQYVFTLVDKQQPQNENVSYCVDPRNAAVAMASDVQLPTVTERDPYEVALRWSPRVRLDPECFFRRTSVELPATLPWCLSYVSVRYRFELRYKAEGSGAEWLTKSVDCGECLYGVNCTDASCASRLQSLDAGVRYEVELVRIPHAYSYADSSLKDTCPHGFADSSPIVWSFYTKDSVPSAGVIMDPSSYSITECTSRCNGSGAASTSSGSCKCRQVTAYWREVPVLKRGGIITHYKVVVNDSVTSKEFEIDSALQNFTYCYCSNNKGSISVQPATVRGTGNVLTISLISIPSADVMKPVEEVIVKRHNSSSALLSWRWRYDGHPSFTAFWCASFQHGCQDINWKHLSHAEKRGGTDRYHVLLHSGGSHIQDVAIGVETAGGQGMGFTQPACVYGQLKTAHPAPMNLLVDVVPASDSTPSEHTLRAQWQPASCSEAGGLLIAYHLFVCTGHGRYGCMEHRVLPNVTALEVRSLRPGTRYSVTLKAAAHNGTHTVHSLTSNTEEVLTTGLNEAAVAGIVAGAIFGSAAMMVGIVCLVHLLRGAVRTVRQGISVPIIRRAPAGETDDAYISCPDAYLLPRSDGERPRQDLAEVGRGWKVDAEPDMDAFEGTLEWNSSYPELNSGLPSTDDYPLLSSSAAMAVRNGEDEAESNQSAAS